MKLLRMFIFLLVVGQCWAAVLVVAAYLCATEIKSRVFSLESLKSDFLLHLVDGSRVGDVRAHDQHWPRGICSSDALGKQNIDYSGLCSVCFLETHRGIVTGAIDEHTYRLSTCIHPPRR